MSVVYVRKKLESNMPLTDKDMTFTFTDTSNFYITNKDGTQKQITTMYTGYNDLDDLIAKAPNFENKLYLTKENKLYAYTGTEYVSIKDENKVELEDISEGFKNSLKKFKTIVFVIQEIDEEGPISNCIQFPFEGSIKECKAFSCTPGTTDTEIAIEKISNVDFESFTNWTNILDSNLIIEKDKRTEDKTYILSNTIIANKDDYYRLNIIKKGLGIKNITVEITIELA